MEPRDHTQSDGNGDADSVEMVELLASAAVDPLRQSDQTPAERVTHWARVGRALEASPGVSQSDIAAVLSDERSYDSVGEAEQAIVQATWEQKMDRRLEALNFSDELGGRRSFSELDADGNVTNHDPD